MTAEYAAIKATHDAHAPIAQAGVMEAGAVCTPVAFWVAK